jgi:hypothetical protein
MTSFTGMGNIDRSCLLKNDTVFIENGMKSSTFIAPGDLFGSAC